MGKTVFDPISIQTLQKTESDRKSTRFDFATLHGKRGAVAVMSVARSFAGFSPRSVLDPSHGHLRFVRSARNFHTGQLTYRDIQVNTH